MIVYVSNALGTFGWLTRAEQPPRQGVLNVRGRQNHLKGFFIQDDWALPRELLKQEVWGEAQHSAFLTDF